MINLKGTLGKQANTEDQVLRDILSANVKKYRSRRKLSQFSLAASADLSTNFIADIEAGNTWVSPSTLMKLAKALEIEVYELLKPEKTGASWDFRGEESRVKALTDQFSAELTGILKDSVEKAIEHVRKEYEQ